MPQPCPAGAIPAFEAKAPGSRPDYYTAANLALTAPSTPDQIEASLRRSFSVVRDLICLANSRSPSFFLRAPETRMPAPARHGLLHACSKPPALQPPIGH